MIGSKTIQLLPNDSHFEGHFPSFPVLPGVVQIEFVQLLAESLCGKSLLVKSVSKSKFVSMIVPPSEITVSLNLSGLKGTWEITVAKTKAASGHIEFEEVLPQ